MRSLDDRQPSDLILDTTRLREASRRIGEYVKPEPEPVRAGSWADALKRQVATLQAACEEYRAEIGRLTAELAKREGA